MKKTQVKGQIQGLGIKCSKRRNPVAIAAGLAGRRRPVIVVRLLPAGLGASVMGTANGAGTLLAGRAIAGVAAATWVPLTVIFSGLFPASETPRVTVNLPSWARRAGSWMSRILADMAGLRHMLGITVLGCLILGLALTRFAAHTQQA